MTAQELRIVANQLTRYLQEQRFSKRVLLVLDGVNELDATDGARKLEWLPPLRTLPSHVRVVIATRPDDDIAASARRAFQLTPTPAQTAPQESGEATRCTAALLEVPALDERSLEALIERFAFAPGGRRPLESTRSAAIAALKSCFPNLFMVHLLLHEMLFLESAESDTIERDLRLMKSMKLAFSLVLARLENQFAEVTVKRALGMPAFAISSVAQTLFSG